MTRCISAFSDGDRGVVRPAWMFILTTVVATAAQTESRSWSR
jgi:hypothetical protein